MNETKLENWRRESGVFLFGEVSGHPNQKEFKAPMQACVPEHPNGELYSDADFARLKKGDKILIDDGMVVCVLGTPYRNSP